MTVVKKTQKIRVLDRVPYICDPMQFQKNKDMDVLTLLNNKSEVNAITPAYVAQLGLKVQKTNVGVKKSTGLY